MRVFGAVLRFCKVEAEIATDESDGAPAARSSAGRRVRGATRTNVRDRGGDERAREREIQDRWRKIERERGGEEGGSEQVSETYPELRAPAHVCWAG